MYYYYHLALTHECGQKKFRPVVGSQNIYNKYARNKNGDNTVISIHMIFVSEYILPADVTAVFRCTHTIKLHMQTFMCVRLSSIMIILHSVDIHCMLLLVSSFI